MVKHLWLIRHAQATESGVGTPDHERPLTDRGLMVATRLGKRLQEVFPDPQQIVSSTALRALTTAQRLAEQYGKDTAGVHTESEIYEASVRTFLQVVNQFPESWERVVVVGHNPAISYLAEYLTGAEIGGLGTASAVYLSQEADSWQEWSGNTATFHQRIDGERLLEG